MPRLSLAEIRSKAMEFAAEWKDAASERAEAQAFWTDLFAVFGLKRRSVASFEEKVRNLKGKYDRIDVFYSGVMIGEHKSRGEDLSKAASQAFDYVQSLTREGRTGELPQYIVVSDFARIVIYDLDPPTSAPTGHDPSVPIADFPTAKLHEHVKAFGFLSGYSTKPIDPEDPINIEAVEVLGALHTQLEKGGYAGHALERFLVRILFCLFADDTGIFEQDFFKQYIGNTNADGSDVGPKLVRLFKVLDTDKPQRMKNLPAEMLELPYVNGELFTESLDFPEFNKAMRDALVECCTFNWSRISPAVFGSLFQSIMAADDGKRKRRQIGAHYTSERDILKLIRSLFLDDLKAELEGCGTNKKKLEAFHDKLATLRFLDPACGCGNFLVVTYRELRQLELDVLKRLHGGKFDRAKLFLDEYLKVNVDQMHGIELEEWPARIAEVAMWLMDHQMNQLAGETFGIPVQRLPLKKSAKIHIGNALRTDWNDVLPAERCSYVLGNPPFVGKQFMSEAQEQDMAAVFAGLDGAGLLDFVTAWYERAAKYLKGTAARAAFVSTNSICQGEQATVLWPWLFDQGVRLHFAHRTFSWQSEARGKAHVHVVIVGFSMGDVPEKAITDYDDESHPNTVPAKFINAYLCDAADARLESRGKPICNVPPIVFGSMPNEAKPKEAELLDRGLSPADAARRTSDQLLLTTEEKDRLLAREPKAAKWVRRVYGSEEFINGIDRWCLWLVGATPAELRAMPAVLERVEVVRLNRSESKRETTRKLAATPYLFGEIRQPASNYLLIPSVSSETRPYIPMGFMPPEVIATNLALLVPDATLYHFGVLTSEMHMSWVRSVCGRLESRYRYSNKLVYNNYPWPSSPGQKQRAAVEEAAQGVLDARAAFPGQTLADLYDPLAMPKALRDAHKTLDRAVDRCYRPQPFDSERQRVEYLFSLYQQLTAPLAAEMRASSKPKRTKAR